MSALDHWSGVDYRKLQLIIADEESLPRYEGIVLVQSKGPYGQVLGQGNINWQVAGEITKADVLRYKGLSSAVT